MRVNDIVLGAFLIAFSVAVIAYTTTFPEFPGQRFGPSLFPRILCAGLIVCGTILVWRGLAARTGAVAAAREWVSIEPWLREPGRAGGFLLVLVLLLFYIFASETVGFIPVALICLTALLLWLGVRVPVALATAVVATLAIQWFFGSMLRVPLPRGWLTEYM